MLTTSCINPVILKTLSTLGHGDKVLIADGNYPLEGRTTTENRVYLGVTAGLPTVTDVLKALTGVSNFEAAEVMLTDDGSIPPIMSDFTNLLGEVPFEKHSRYDFYSACCTAPVKLAISTGEKRVYANILLTIGVA